MAKADPLDCAGAATSGKRAHSNRPVRPSGGVHMQDGSATRCGKKVTRECVDGPAAAGEDVHWPGVQRGDQPVQVGDRPDRGVRTAYCQVAGSPR